MSSTTTSSEEWRQARLTLLRHEKELLIRQDEVAEMRRGLPHLEVKSEYRFEAAQGERSLSDLFEGAKQLVVYHFMMGPDWEVGCPSCSFWADNFNGTLQHLRDRDTQFVAIARAPMAHIEAYKKRMGWSFPWYSSLGSDFNRDFGVLFAEGEPQSDGYNYAPVGPGPEERHGLSVFTKGKNGTVFHTYSTYARGAEVINGAYNVLDLTPQGRGESEFDFPMQWVRRHDEYEG